ncbi:prepilin-type cleavage/methylation domain-containing protein [Methylococcaceae bacterium HT1]|nr:prepilin-type cleavage/methylation domain-containing protein [Methylococcaceae bacterium HT1]TXL14872.1 prepilin-type cleavage/methylation domain-containing protein [Methylococcaceae bacterium HT3]TXL21749.1 prepilin-type cleavage/methylation domain-containing protein [Methylococcaceae bacterium HT2]
MITEYKAHQRGFTLLEVLIGMSIMSIMMLLLFASLRICVQNWNAGEKKIAQVSQAAVIQNFLQSKLHATVPLEGDFLEEPEFSFQGDQSQIQFVAAMPASAGRLGLQRFKMSLRRADRDEQGSYLQVEIQPFFPQDEGQQGIEEPIVILKKIHSLQFAYFGSDSDARNNDPVWHNDWLEMDSLPKLVSIDIELVDGEIWPQLVVALKIDSTFGDTKSDSSFGIVGGKVVSANESE